MECYSHLRIVQDLLSDGKTPNERRLGEPFNGPIIPLASMAEYHPISAKDQARLNQFGQKVLPGIIVGYALYAGRNLEKRQELKNLDASEIHARRLNAREVLAPKNGDEFICPCADGTVKLAG